MFDAHAHVHDPRFDEDRDAVLERARENGVRGIVVIGTAVDTSRSALALARRHADLWCTVGIHPHRSDTATDADLAVIAALAAEPEVVGIGECGYDHGPHAKGTLAEQDALFRRHIELARETDLPLVLHVRDAFEPLFAAWDELVRDDVRAILHCFTGTREEARGCVERGMWVSFSGVITYKNAPEVRAAAAEVPADRVLIETDCPYLAPTPAEIPGPRSERGRRNEPAFLAHTLAAVAKARGLTLAEADALTEQNTRAAFRLDREPTP